LSNIGGQESCLGSSVSPGRWNAWRVPKTRPKSHFVRGRFLLSCRTVSQNQDGVKTVLPTVLELPQVPRPDLDGHKPLTAATLAIPAGHARNANRRGPPRGRLAPRTANAARLGWAVTFAHGSPSVSARNNSTNSDAPACSGFRRTACPCTTAARR